MYTATVYRIATSKYSYASIFEARDGLEIPHTGVRDRIPPGGEIKKQDSSCRNRVTQVITSRRRRVVVRVGVGTLQISEAGTWVPTFTTYATAYHHPELQNSHVDCGRSSLVRDISQYPGG